MGEITAGRRSPVAGRGRGSGGSMREKDGIPDWEVESWLLSPIHDVLVLELPGREGRDDGSFRRWYGV